MLCGTTAAQLFLTPDLHTVSSNKANLTASIKNLPRLAHVEQQEFQFIAAAAANWFQAGSGLLEYIQEERNLHKGNPRGKRALFGKNSSYAGLFGAACEAKYVGGNKNEHQLRIYMLS